MLASKTELYSVVRARPSRQRRHRRKPSVRRAEIAWDETLRGLWIEADQSAEVPLRKVAGVLVIANPSIRGFVTV